MEREELLDATDTDGTGIRVEGTINKEKDIEADKNDKTGFDHIDVTFL